jgi:hypothetical protein
MFETTTLVQTGKISKPMPMVLFGTDYWDDVLDMKKMAEWGTISSDDPDLLFCTNSVDEAFEYLTAKIIENEAAGGA